MCTLDQNSQMYQAPWQSHKSLGPLASTWQAQNQKSITQKKKKKENLKVAPFSIYVPQSFQKRQNSYKTSPQYIHIKVRSHVREVYWFGDVAPFVIDVICTDGFK